MYTSIVRSEITKFIRLTNFKKIMNSHIVYLCNTILLPKIKYILSTTFLLEKQTTDLFRPIINLVKWKCFLATSMPTTVITHSSLLNLILLWKNQMDYHFTELSVRLNSTGWDNISTLIRLREAQNLIADPNCILFESPNLFELLRITNNLSFNILKV